MNYPILDDALYREPSEYPLLMQLERVLADLRKEPSVEDWERISTSAFELVEFSIQELSDHSGVPIDKASVIVTTLPMFERATRTRPRRSGSQDLWCLTLDGVIDTLKYIRNLSKNNKHEKPSQNYSTPLEAAKMLLREIRRGAPGLCDKKLAIEGMLLQLEVSRNHINDVIRENYLKKNLFVVELTEMNEVQTALERELSS